MTLFAHYPLQEDSGTTAYDASGNGRNGTISGPTVGENGLLDTTSYSFDATDDFVELGQNTHPEQITACGWIYNTGFGGGADNKGVIALGLNSGSNNQSAVYYDVVTNSWQIRFGTGGSSTTETVTDVAKNVWSHIAFTYDSDANWSWYIDGVLEDSGTSGDGSIADGSREWYLGTFAFDPGTGNFGGRMADVRIYDHALTSSEIRYIHNVAKDSNILTANKSLSSATSTPTLGSLSYDQSLAAESLEAEVTGTDGTPETVTQTLDGASSYNLTFANAHSEYEVRFNFSTTDVEETPVLSSASISADSGTVDSASITPVLSVSLSSSEKRSLIDLSSISQSVADELKASETIELAFKELAGTVTLANNGIEGAKIYIINDTNGDIEAETTTDANGDYSVTVDTDNVYHVAVQYEDSSGNQYNDESKPFIVT